MCYLEIQTQILIESAKQKQKQKKTPENDCFGEQKSGEERMKQGFVNLCYPRIRIKSKYHKRKQSQNHLDLMQTGKVRSVRQKKPEVLVFQMNDQIRHCKADNGKAGSGGKSMGRNKKIGCTLDILCLKVDEASGRLDLTVSGLYLSSLLLLFANFNL